MMLRAWSVTSALVLLGIQGEVVAQQAAAARELPLQIEAQALGPALQELARQSGVQIVFFSRLTEGLSTQGLAGNFTVSAALERLLAETGLTFRDLGGQTFEVGPRPRAAQSRPPALPAAPALAAQMMEVLVTGKAEQLVATRVPTAVREIPQTISIVSRREIEEQNARDLGDVLDRTSGIVLVRTNTLDPMFYARGYQIKTFHLDGGAAVNPHIDWEDNALITLVAPPDLSEFDHVEILRGADALFGGFGNPGGTVSLVRKRPLREFALNASAIGGSWDSRRVELDVTGPLAADGALRGRAVAMYSQQEYFYDLARRDRRKLFGALEYDFTPDATLTAGGSFETDDSKPFLDGMLLYSDGTRPDYSRRQTMMFGFNYQQTDLSQAYLQYRQTFAEHWNLRLNVAGWRADVAAGYGAFATYIDASSNVILDGGQAVRYHRPNENRQGSFDVTLTGTLNLFGRRQEVALGVDKLRLVSDFDFGRYHPFPDAYLGVDFQDFDPRAVASPWDTQEPWHTSVGRSSLDQYGFFASLRFFLSDDWSVIAGTRLNGDTVTLRAHGEGDLGVVDTLDGSDESDVLTPFFGISYDVTEHLTTYASYAEMFLNENTFAGFGTAEVGTIQGYNAELGIKGAWRDGALNASLAAYSIAQKNLPVEDPDDFLRIVPGTSRSHGVELDIHGELAPGWRIGGGYAWNVNEAPFAAGPQSRSTPRHLLKLWTDKQMSGSLERWNFGGSLHAQTEITATDEAVCPPIFVEWGFCEPVLVEEPSYAVLDLRAGLRIDENWRLALNVNNVFDKVYAQTLGPPLMRIWYGEPRNFSLRLDARF